MQISVSFAPDEATEAVAVVAILAKAVEPGKETSSEKKPLPNVTLPDIIRLFEQMAENESPRFLAALTEEPRLFEEIGESMASDGGPLHDAASVRAIYRNVRRREKGMIEAGILSGPVVQADFSNYDEDNAGRYYLESGALEALNAYMQG